MVSSFYRANAKRLLWLVAISFPWLYMQAESIPSNNDIETWLPRESDVRTVYDHFKQDFGAEEVILVGIHGRTADDPLVDAAAARIERLDGIKQCWSPARLQSVMREFEVPEAEARRNLDGLALSPDERMVGLVALLSDHGLKHRAGTVAEIREVLEYCQLDGDDVHLAGAPVVVAELDRLGSRSANKRFFFISLAICLCLLFVMLREWRLSFAILGVTIWAIQGTVAALKLCGGEMNFILGALSIMVMVFTMSNCLHIVHYCRSSQGERDPLGAALKLAWKPMFYSALTTVIGLGSLGVSDFGPVRQFGSAGSLGCVIALLAGLGITPAVIVCCPDRKRHEESAGTWLSRYAERILPWSGRIVAASAVVVLVTGYGVFQLRTKIDPLDFLPKNGKVLQDVLTVERELTSASSIEAVVDLGGRDLPFLDKVAEVRRLDEAISRHPAVRHTLSVASFFPERMPQDPFAAAALLRRAKERRGDSDYYVEADDLFRISARIRNDGGKSRHEVLQELQALTAGEPIRFTGIAPLLEHAQSQIYQGFWESFASSFLIITAIMCVALRSLKTGLVAMIPNVAPISIVFGVLGWIDFPMDIGMMMTGSIALGIAVDGTFHFIIRYEERYKQSRDATDSSRHALLATGFSITSAAVIASLGMMALTLSNFAPTARFGYMMATLLTVALAGDMLLLPCLLALRRRTRTKSEVAPASPHRRTRFYEKHLRAARTKQTA